MRALFLLLLLLLVCSTRADKQDEELWRILMERSEPATTQPVAEPLFVPSVFEGRVMSSRYRLEDFHE